MVNPARHSWGVLVPTRCLSARAEENSVLVQAPSIAGITAELLELIRAAPSTQGYPGTSWIRHLGPTAPASLRSDVSRGQSRVSASAT